MRKLIMLGVIAIGALVGSLAEAAPQTFKLPCSDKPYYIRNTALYKTIGSSSASTVGLGESATFQAIDYDTNGWVIFSDYPPERGSRTYQWSGPGVFTASTSSITGYMPPQIDGVYISTITVVEFASEASPIRFWDSYRNVWVVVATQTPSAVATITTTVVIPVPTTAEIVPGSMTIVVDGTQVVEGVVYSQTGAKMHNYSGTFSVVSPAGIILSNHYGTSAELTAGPKTGTWILEFTPKQGVSGFATITLTHGTPTDVAVSPGSITLQARSTATVTGTVTDARGNVCVGALIAWSLENPASGSITPTLGTQTLLTAGTLAGTTRLLAQCGGIGIATITITVRSPKIYSIGSQTAGTAFQFEFEIPEFVGSVSVGMKIGTCIPGSISVTTPDGITKATITVYTAGTQTITIWWIGGSMTSNEFLIVSAPFATLTQSGSYQYIFGSESMASVRLSGFDAFGNPAPFGSGAKIWLEPVEYYADGTWSKCYDGVTYYPTYKDDHGIWHPGNSYIVPESQKDLTVLEFSGNDGRDPLIFAAPGTKIGKNDSEKGRFTVVVWKP